MVPISIPSRAGYHRDPIDHQHGCEHSHQSATRAHGQVDACNRDGKEFTQGQQDIHCALFQYLGILSGLKMLDGFAMVSTASKSRSMPMVPYFCQSTRNLVLSLLPSDYSWFLPLLITLHRLMISIFFLLLLPLTA